MCVTWIFAIITYQIRKYLNNGVSDNYWIFESPLFLFISKSTIISVSIMKFFIILSIIFISTFLYFVFSCFIKFKKFLVHLNLYVYVFFLILCVIAYCVNSSFTLWIPRFFIPQKFLDSNKLSNSSIK